MAPECTELPPDLRRDAAWDLAPLHERRDALLDQLLPPGVQPLFHISTEPGLDGVWAPRIPPKWNRLQGEDSAHARISVSGTLHGCLIGMSDESLPDFTRYGGRYFVYAPLRYSGAIVTPDEHQVPDVAYSLERWLTSPAHMICIGEVTVPHDHDESAGEVRIMRDGKRLTLFIWGFYVIRWTDPHFAAGAQPTLDPAARHIRKRASC